MIRILLDAVVQGPEQSVLVPLTEEAILFLFLLDLELCLEVSIENRVIIMILLVKNEGFVLQEAVEMLERDGVGVVLLALLRIALGLFLVLLLLLSRLYVNELDDCIKVLYIFYR